MKEEPQSPPPQPKSKSEPPEQKAEEARPRKPAYVFKILPADPKNSFDFEDVADK
jgi:hypothetical protein